MCGKRARPGRAWTHNLVVGAAGIVGPGRLLHDVAGDGLKVHEVVALLEDGHALNALLARLLVRIELLLVLLDRVHVDLAQVLGLVEVLVERVGRVDGLKGLGGILAGILEDDLGAAGVLRQEFGHVVGTAMDNDPARVCVVVRGDVLARELLLLRVVAVAVHGGGEGGRRISNGRAAVEDKIYGDDARSSQALGRGRGWTGGWAGGWAEGSGWRRHRHSCSHSSPGTGGSGHSRPSASVATVGEGEGEGEARPGELGRLRIGIGIGIGISISASIRIQYPGAPMASSIQAQVQVGTRIGRWAGYHADYCACSNAGQTLRCGLGMTPAHCPIPYTTAGSHTDPGASLCLLPSPSVTRPPSRTPFSPP